MQRISSIAESAQIGLYQPSLTQRHRLQWECERNLLKVLLHIEIVLMMGWKSSMFHLVESYPTSILTCSTSSLTQSFLCTYNIRNPIILAFINCDLEIPFLQKETTVFGAIHYEHGDTFSWNLSLIVRGILIMTHT